MRFRLVPKGDAMTGSVLHFVNDNRSFHPLHYRAFFLSHERKPPVIVTFMAVDDADAIEIAVSMSDDYTIDLWEGMRFIDSIAQKRPQRDAEPGTMP